MPLARIIHTQFPVRYLHLIVPVSLLRCVAPWDAKKFYEFWGRSYRSTSIAATFASLLLNVEATWSLHSSHLCSRFFSCVGISSCLRLNYFPQSASHSFRFLSTVNKSMIRQIILAFEGFSTFITLMFLYTVNKWVPRQTILASEGFSALISLVRFLTAMSSSFPLLRPCSSAGTLTGSMSLLAEYKYFPHSASH